MKRVILTGFRRFGDYKVNSSQVVAENLRGVDLAGFRIINHIFDATIPLCNEDRGRRLFAKARGCYAYGIISLGMTSECQGLQVEALAHNKINNDKYCPPKLNRTSINQYQPYDYPLAMDLIPWKYADFERECYGLGIKTKISEDAGGFCCNHLAYQLARQQHLAKAPLPCIFIHIPCCSEAVEGVESFDKAKKITMTTETVIKGLEILLSGAKL